MQSKESGVKIYPTLVIQGLNTRTYTIYEHFWLGYSPNLYLSEYKIESVTDLNSWKCVFYLFRPDIIRVFYCTVNALEINHEVKTNTVIKQYY